MPRTTAYGRGRVVLIGFVFADESGSKLRPAAIVSSPSYHRGRREVIVAAITSNVQRRWPIGSLTEGDLRVVDRELRRSLAL